MLTERLELAPLAELHASMLLAIFNDSDFVRYVGDKGLRTEADAVGYIQQGPMMERQRSGLTNYAVRRIGESRWLGTCGLLQRPYFSAPDIGYGFLPDARGHGYAREAAQAVIQQADQDHRAQLWAMVNPANKRSLALLNTLGFTEVGPHEHQCPLAHTTVLNRKRPSKVDTDSLAITTHRTTV